MEHVLPILGIIVITTTSTIVGQIIYLIVVDKVPLKKIFTDLTNKGEDEGKKQISK